MSDATTAARSTRGVLTTAVAGVLEKLRPGSGSDRPDAALLRACTLPDPEALRVELARARSTLARLDATWTATASASDPRTLLQRPALAQHLLAQRAAVDTLTADIQIAEAQRAAFVRLAGLAVEARAAVQDRVHEVLAHPPSDEQTRLAALAEIADLDAHANYLAGALAKYSASPQFRVSRRPAVHAVRDRFTAFAQEADRTRPRCVVFDPSERALLATLDGHPQPRKDTP